MGSYCNVKTSVYACYAVRGIEGFAVDVIIRGHGHQKNLVGSHPGIEEGSEKMDGQANAIGT